MSSHTPYECGHSINVQGTFVCKLSCLPCKAPCELVKHDKMIDTFIHALKECAKKE